MENKSNIIWRKELVGVIAAIGSLLTAIFSLGYLEGSRWFYTTVLLMSISLSLVAALTKIIHITFDGKKNKPRKTR